MIISIVPPQSCFKCIKHIQKLYTLGPAYSEFGYNEYPAITSK